MANVTLYATQGPETGRKVWIRDGYRCKVGRTDRADVAFPQDAAMSGLHFEIDNRNSTCQIADCGSTNGTFVNEEKVSHAVLHDGDTVVAGATVFIVTMAVQEGSGRTVKKVPMAGPNLSQGPGPVVSSPATHADPPLAQKEDSVERLSGREKSSEMREIQAIDSASLGPNVPETPVTPLPASTESAEDEDVTDPLLAIMNPTGFLAAAMPWENSRGEGRLTVLVKATMTLASQPQPAPEQLPILIADEPLSRDDPSLVRLESDFVPFKPRADIVVVGHVHAPQQHPVTQLDATLRVGSVSKTVRVFGDRTWSFPTLAQMIPRMTSPKPFTKMELSYARAFGGIDEYAGRYCAENLAGVGFIGQLAVDSIHNKPLPNFEDPQNVIVDWESHPKPQGFGFYGRGWMPRLKGAGTFDEEYLENRSPLPPEDASHDVHNGAHPDLQVAGYLRGDEDVELVNLSPHGNVQTKLPGLRPKIQLTRIRTRADGESSMLEEQPVMPYLDTLVFLPDQGLFYLVYRAVFAVPSLDEIDVSCIHISCEFA